MRDALGASALEDAEAPVSHGDGDWPFEGTEASSGGRSQPVPSRWGTVRSARASRARSAPRARGQSAALGPVEPDETRVRAEEGEQLPVERANVPAGASSADLPKRSCSLFERQPSQAYENHPPSTNIDHGSQWRAYWHPPSETGRGRASARDQGASASRMERGPATMEARMARSQNASRPDETRTLTIVRDMRKRRPRYLRRYERPASRSPDHI